MRLNHIDLQVSDVDVAREFFERFFGLHCRYQRQKQIAIFENDTGFEFAVSNLFSSAPPSYPPDFHVGFVLEHSSEVRNVYDRRAREPLAYNYVYNYPVVGDGLPIIPNLGVKGSF